jgi:hypothetical protein
MGVSGVKRVLMFPPDNYSKLGARVMRVRVMFDGELFQAYSR